MGRAGLAEVPEQTSHDLQAPTTRLVDLTEGDDPVAGWNKDARAEARRAEREGTTVTIDLKNLVILRAVP